MKKYFKKFKNKWKKIRKRKKKQLGQVWENKMIKRVKLAKQLKISRARIAPEKGNKMKGL